MSEFRFGDRVWFYAGMGFCGREPEPEQLREGLVVGTFVKQELCAGGVPTGVPRVHLAYAEEADPKSVPSYPQAHTTHVPVELVFRHREDAAASGHGIGSTSGWRPSWTCIPAGARCSRLRRTEARTRVRFKERRIAMMDGTAYRKCLVESLRTEHAYLLANREPTPEVVCALVQALSLKIEVLEDRVRSADRARSEVEERIGRMESGALTDRLLRIMDRVNPGAS